MINALQPISNRNDTGALWENFLLSERMKQLHYKKDRSGMYFWRTKTQQEIDYVEERENKIYGYEFKWKPKRNIRFPITFVNTYNAKTQSISRDNFREFVFLEK